MKIRSVIYLFIVMAIVSSCSKGGGSSTPTTPPVSLPIASISDVSNERAATNAKFQFSITLDKTSSSAITINYTTADGTALANTDYKPVSGTLTIPANSTTGTIEVEVTGDSTRKPNQAFSIQLSNPNNCSLATNKATGTIINENLLYFPVDNTGYSTPLSYPGMNLVWSDEFDGNTINPATWTFETGAGGWGNAELETYTGRTQNAFQSKGNLIIEARKENVNGSVYTSARMITKSKKIFTYGRIDIRAKVPTAKGMWPALWMLGNNIDTVGWPACGEMDIMEVVGQEPNKVHGTLHWGATPLLHASKEAGYVLPTGTFDQQFHVFSMVWVKDQVQIYIDDILYNTITTANTAGSQYPFNSNFFFIFNLAVGGNWPGPPDASTVFPQRMIVDYVRVFK